MKFREAALLLFSTLIVACSDSGVQPSNISEATSTAPRKPVNFKVVLILKSFTNPFFVEMAKGARLAQRETGVELEIKSATPDMSAEQQIRLVNNQTKAQVSAIVISPVDTRLLVPHLKDRRAHV